MQHLPEPDLFAIMPPAMSDVTPPKKLEEVVKTYDPAAPKARPQDGLPVELGGPKGPEPTRYGDWEKKGRCIDF